MRLVVIIVTASRRQIAGLALARLKHQTRPPDLVVVSAPDANHVDNSTCAAYPIVFSFGAHGCTAQRNNALDSIALQDTDVVVFLDDDFVPANDYLEQVEEAFNHHSDWAILTGHVIADGVKGLGIDFDEAIGLLDGTSCSDRSSHELILRAGAYGCNMAYRAAAIGTLRFDERLPLYGWQEDTDFSRRVARGKPVVRLFALRGVHLGTKGGRVSGVCFGYSQLANPVYLVRKGTGSARWAASLIAKNIIANAVLSLRPEAHVDRQGRLKGNLIAFGHLLRGRIEPEYIMKL